MSAPIRINLGGPAPGVIAQTSAGHPTSGTWVAGQAVIDSVGIVWICAVAGSPGIWSEGAGDAAGAAAAAQSAAEAASDASGAATTAANAAAAAAEALAAADFIPLSQKGAAGGLATLTGTQLTPSQVPDSVKLAAAPAVSTAYTYNSDGTVATATKDGETDTFSYNGDGTIHSVAHSSGGTETYAYNGNGSVAGSAVA